MRGMSEEHDILLKRLQRRTTALTSLAQIDAAAIHVKVTLTPLPDL